MLDLVFEIVKEIKLEPKNQTYSVEKEHNNKVLKFDIEISMLDDYSFGIVDVVKITLNYGLIAYISYYLDFVCITYKANSFSVDNSEIVNFLKICKTEEEYFQYSTVKSNEEMQYLNILRVLENKMNNFLEEYKCSSTYQELKNNIGSIK